MSTCDTPMDQFDSKLWCWPNATLFKTVDRKTPSFSECTEANEAWNQEQILWAWGQVARWSKNLYSASWKPIHSGALAPGMDRET